MKKSLFHLLLHGLGKLISLQIAQTHRHLGIGMGSFLEVAFEELCLYSGAKKVSVRLNRTCLLCSR